MNHMSENEVTSQEPEFSNGFLQLYSVANVESAPEATTILLHAFLLEVGFIPNDVSVSNVFQQMPENWKANGICKILYYHKDIKDVQCWVTYVPLCGKLSIQGSLLNDQLKECTVCFSLKLNTFVNTSDDFENPHSVFSHSQELSINFKDGFCFPLLALFHESVNEEHSFGLNGLVDEVKVFILKLLPVESVVSLSAVNKRFHTQANLTYLWKFLFIRDYGPGDPKNTTDVEEDWKEMYKAEYLKRKRRHEFPSTRQPVYHPYLLPEIFPVGPNYGVDMRINMDPALQLAFPNLRSRFRPNWPFPGGYQGYQYFRM